MTKKENHTHRIDGRKGRKADALAIFNDRPATATQIHETILAPVEAQLTAPDDQGAVPDGGDVRGAVDSATEEETRGHGIDG